MHRGVVAGGLVLLLAGCAESTPTTGNPFTVAPVGGAAGTGAAGTGFIPPTGTSGRGGTSGGLTGTSGVGSTLPPGVGGAGATPGGSGMGGTAGTMAMGGTGASGMGASGTGASGTGSTPTEPGVVEPVVPMVTEECPGFRNGTITFMGLGGIIVQAGSKASAPTAPMIFYWHGTGSVASEYSGSFGSGHQQAMTEGGVLISFNGTTGGDLLSGTAIFGRGDFELTDQLFACAVKDHNVDPRRVFSTGCSAGGLFAAGMAAARSNYLAAAAPNSGGWTTPVAFQNDWTPALMTVHGAMGRDVVIIDFANSSRTADTAFKNRGGFVINCDHGGGHCGGRAFAPDMWEFFKAHPYGTKPSPWTGGLPSGFNSDCVIF